MTDVSAKNYVIKEKYFPKKKKKPRMILLNIKLIMYECVCMFNQWAYWFNTKLAQCLKIFGSMATHWPVKMFTSVENCAYVKEE